jgi:cyclophilin family peptidyl-prolyl cis-trans isomerase
MNKKSLLLGLFLAGLLALGGGLLLRNLARNSIEFHTLEGVADFDGRAATPRGQTVRHSNELRFPEFPQPELLWITGYRTKRASRQGSPDGTEPSFEVNVDFDAAGHAQMFELPVYGSERLFALPSETTEVKFPEGFGLPFYSDEVLTLNWNRPGTDSADSSTGLRQQVAITYVLDRDLDDPMKPLYVTTAEITSNLEAPPVSPPFDTRVHFVAGNVRSPVASIELRDTSTGETVYNSATSGPDPPGSILLASDDGIRLFQEHAYQWSAVLTDSPLADPVTPAVVQLFLRDKLFKKRPRYLASVRHVDEPVEIGDQRLMIQTNHGEIQIGLYPEVAPNHVAQILNLAKLGVYDSVPFHRVEPGFLIQLGYPEGRLGPPLTPEQQAALKPLKAEITDLPQRRWTVSMALHNNADPDSAEASFFILFDDVRRLDQRFTIVGRILGGMGTLHSIANVPTNDSVPIDPVFIESVQVMTRNEIVEAREGR